MAWIESHDNIGTHPKTRRAARMLGVSIPTMVGHLHLLWHWCLTYAEDGDLTGYDAQDIADAAMWEGEPQQFVDALIHCGPGNRAGFLVRAEDGRLLVHDWMDYAGRLVQARQEASEAGARGNHERWHVQRGKIDPSCPYCRAEHADLSPESGGDRGAIGGRSGPDSGSDRVLSHHNRNHNQIYAAAANARARACAREDVASDESGDAATPDPITDDGVTPEAYYEQVVGVLGSSVAVLISDAIAKGLQPSAVKWAIREFSVSKARSRTYLASILDRLVRERLFTAEEAEAARSEAQEQRPPQHRAPPARSRMTYEEQQNILDEIVRQMKQEEATVK